MTRLYTLGRFALVAVGPKGERPIATQPKRLALLAYLAAAAPSGLHRRDTLLGLLWPELGREEARRALRQALHYLRRHAGESAIESSADDQVGLSAALWSDVATFERALHGREEEALELYRGDFLHGVFLEEVAPEFEDWVERTRTRLRTAAGEAAWRLQEREEARGNGAAACAAAVRAHALMPDDEGALRRTLAVLERHGDRARALRLFDEFAQRLESEFGVTPASETVAMIARLRAKPSTLTPAPNRPLGEEGVAERTHSHAADASANAEGANAGGRLSPGLRRISWWIVAAAALLLTTVIATRYQGTAAHAEPAPVFDRIFVADFADLSGDSVLTRALSEAVRVDIGQYPGVRVLSPQRIASALRRSTLSPDVVIDDSLARELGAREGVKAIVTGEVARLGDRYMLAARLLAVSEGELIASVREEADSTQLLDAVGRLTRRLRRDLGESLGSLRQSPPLREVTTPSLTALQKYTEALHLHENRGERDAALTLLDEALAIDTAFASAYRAKGVIHSANANPGAATAALREAFAHRERLALRERYLTMGSYYRNVSREYDKAVTAYQALLRLYPQDIAGLNNLSLVYAQQRAYAPAETLLRRLIAIDSSIPSVYLGLGQSLINQGRFGDARTLLDDVARRFPDFPVTPLTETYLAAAQQDWTTAERHIRVRLERGLATGRLNESGDAYQTLGQILMIRGRLGDGEEALRSAMTTFEHLGTWRRVLFSAVQLGWLELRYRNDSARALALVDSVLARVDLARISSDDRPYGELSELFAALAKPERIRELLALAERDTAARLDLDGPAGHAMRGFLALAEGQHRAAALELRQASLQDRCPICALPGLAAALERRGDNDGAVATLERYRRTPWMFRFESDAPHLAWSLHRLGDLYARTGRRADATAAIDAALALWANADPELTARRDSLRHLRTELVVR